MSKLMRAGFEAIITICITLAISIGAFAPMFGYEDLLALSGLYYAIWSAVILITHLALAKRRRHIRLSFGVATGVIVMGAHLVLYIMGTIDTDIGLVPVILHDFGFALVSLIALNIVHLVIFRRRVPIALENEFSDGRPVAPSAPSAAERVDEVPDPEPIKRAKAAKADSKARQDA